MIEELYKAIVTRYTSSAGSTVRGLVGETSSVKKLWNSQAPQDTATPYITFEMPAAGIDWTMGADLDNPLVQFSIWDDSVSPNTAIQIGDAIRDLYNNVKLSMTNGYTMVRADPVTPGRTFRDPDDKGWQVVIEIEFILEKDR